jgi:hypothetical protein
MSDTHSPALKLASVAEAADFDLESTRVSGLGRRSAGARRAAQAFDNRVALARCQRLHPLPPHRTNGDEDLYPDKIGSYSKGLPHDALGEVDLAAYRSLQRALSTGSGNDFERIVLGVGAQKLTNPQGGLAFTTIGPDAQALAQKPAPAFSSAEEAGEIVESYWMALARDVPFADYEAHPLTQAAAADLTSLSDFRGPKEEGTVTAQTLFRNAAPGELEGPYVSQFMLLEAPFGAETVDRKIRAPLPGRDHLTSYPEWLAVQNGAGPAASIAFDTTRRYIRTGRDLGEAVHSDVLFQACFNALFVLLRLEAPFDARNPYNASRTQTGFCTLGPPYMASVLSAVAREALKQVWFQKWFVHRRLRPEAFAGCVHNHLTSATSYPLHADVLGSAAVQEVFRRNGTYLLPMAFPEGCPTHPSYGAGHATVAGACVTILKALFDEDFEIAEPVVASPDGLSLERWNGTTLTVGGELNKLASNVAGGRNLAGVHWRSDAVESLKLGEELALRFLSDERRTFSESFPGFTLRKFDGTAVVV